MTHRPHRKGTQALHTTHQVMGVFSQFGSKVHNRFIFHGRISNCTCIISPCLSYGAKIFSVHKITQYFLLCGFPCISIAVVLFCSPVEVPLEDLGMPVSEEFFAFLHCASPRYPWGARVSQELDDHTAKALAPVTQGRV